MLEEGRGKVRRESAWLGPAATPVEEEAKRRDRKTEREERWWIYLYIRCRDARGAREERAMGGEGLSRSESTILHHWRPFWTTQVAVRA